MQKILAGISLVILITACSQQNKKNMKVSDEYPGVKLGFSTQNFLACMPVSVENLKELIDYAAAEGYAFIELRDPAADLSQEDCRMIATHAKARAVEVIYEIHMDLFAPGFMEVFERAVINATMLGKPGILRSILSWSEFQDDEHKQGWTGEELDYLTSLADSCANLARKEGIQFVLENIIEPWTSNDGGYGLADFFDATSVVGLQFDTANPFLPSCRGIAEPGEVAEYLGDIADRWITTHLKCGKDGMFQPRLTENPLPYVTVFELMSENGVEYAALELYGEEDKQACFDNHAASIGYLKEIGIIE